MTDREQLEFLLDILKESGKWSRSDDDPSGLELEFNDRLSKLLSVPTDRLIGTNDPEGTRPVEAWTPAKEENCIKRWKSTRRRVRIGDVYKWVPLDKLKKEMIGESKFRWALKDPE